MKPESHKAGRLISRAFEKSCYAGKMLMILKNNNKFGA